MDKNRELRAGEPLMLKLDLLSKKKKKKEKRYK